MTARERSDPEILKYRKMIVSAVNKNMLRHADEQDGPLNVESTKVIMALKVYAVIAAKDSGLNTEVIMNHLNSKKGNSILSALLTVLEDISTDGSLLRLT